MAACGKPKKEEAKEDDALSVFAASAVKYLKSKKVSDILNDDDNKPVTIPAGTTLEEAMKTLKDSNVKSAPVTDQAKTVGLLDLGSIMKYQIREKKKLLGEGVASSGASMPKDKPNDVTYLARMRKYKEVKSDASLFELAQALNNVPAVGVLKKGDLAAVVSQGRLAKAIVKSECLKDCKLTVGELFKEKKTPANVDSSLNSDDLLTVFETMGKKNRSSFAILSAEDKSFLGAVDITDTDKFTKMNDAKATTAGDYLAKQQSNKALTCDSNLTVVEALGKICSKKSHRIFVIDDKKLQTVLALTDVIKVLCVRKEEQKAGPKKTLVQRA